MHFWKYLCLFVGVAVSTNRNQNSGHFSNTYADARCWACKATATAALAAGTVVTCVFTLGWGCAAAAAAAAAAVAGAIDLCSHSGACCPVACGRSSNFPGADTCCWGDEACLDGRGHCCAPGSILCAGVSCCNSADQVCIDRGPQKGTCCPDTGEKTSTCGHSCCGDLQTCFDEGKSRCCDSDMVCNLVCCGENSVLPPGSLFTDAYCADSSSSLCCPTSKIACGGECCNPDLCVSGKCTLRTPEWCQEHDPVARGACPHGKDSECVLGGLPGSCVEGCCHYLF